MQFVSNHFTVIYDMLDHIKHIGATIYESCLRIIYNSEIIDAGRLRIIYNGEIIDASRLRIRLNGTKRAMSYRPHYPPLIT